MICSQKQLLISLAVPPAPVRVPSQRPLARSVASVTSVANDKGDNEMILGAVHRSPGICLNAEENPRKPQLGGRLMKGLCDQSSPQMGSFSSKWGRWDRTARQEVRRKELRKGPDRSRWISRFVRKSINLYFDHCIYNIREKNYGDGKNATLLRTMWFFDRQFINLGIYYKFRPNETHMLQIGIPKQSH